jgi:hypothetical protein
MGLRLDDFQQGEPDICGLMARLQFPFFVFFAPFAGK